MKSIMYTAIFLLLLTSQSCKNDDPASTDQDFSGEWVRDASNPVFRDVIPDINFEVASDPHIFYDENNQLKMIYTGDVNDVPSIKLASGSKINKWNIEKPLLFEAGASGKDINKETAFYRKSGNGKHQIYYIGYEDEDTYKAQVYLAEADNAEGPYTPLADPVVERGLIAGEEVYLITSPSIVEHQGQLYMMFIGWDAKPSEVTEVWVLGAVSNDEGHTWSDFQKVDTRIGMEGQVTKVDENQFVAVRTGDYEGTEAIFYATSDHPFGPWSENPEPVLVKAGAPLEKDEIIAPQITIDPASGEEYLFYTGADHSKGWWIMLANKK